MSDERVTHEPEQDENGIETGACVCGQQHVSRETSPALDVPPTGRTLHNVLQRRREIT
jgi:hypothetical protein